MAALRQAIDGLELQRRTLFDAYPLLTHITSAQHFLDMPKDEQRAWVGSTVGGVNASIGQTRDYAEGGRLELWSQRPLVEATLAAGGFEDPRLVGTIRARSDESKDAEAMTDMALAVGAHRHTRAGLGVAWTPEGGPGSGPPPSSRGPPAVPPPLGHARGLRVLPARSAAPPGTGTAAR